MILLADSGSTKTEWCLAGPRGKIGKRLFTPGINPYYMNKEEIQRTIDEELYPQLRRYHDKIEAIHFYGAGCAYPEKNDMVAAALRRHWQVPVSVESDLLAAAHALCGHEAGIACILEAMVFAFQSQFSAEDVFLPGMGIFIAGREGEFVIFAGKVVALRRAGQG